MIAAKNSYHSVPIRLAGSIDTRAAVTNRYKPPIGVADRQSSSLGLSRLPACYTPNETVDTRSILCAQVNPGQPLQEDRHLTRRGRVLSEDHPDTLVTANYLALALHELGEATL